MCSIYGAIRRVAQGENARLVLMDMVPNEDDGGEAFNEEEEIDSDDELEISDHDLESDDELEMRDLEAEAEMGDGDGAKTLDFDPDDIPEAEE